MRNLLENCVASERFKMSECHRVTGLLDNGTSAKLTQLYVMFGKKHFTSLLEGLIRFSFLIELVKDDVTSTKFEVRWSARLLEDPRYSSFDECIEIFTNLIDVLLGTDENQQECVKKFFSFSILPYELPIDYIERYQDGRRIHVLNNIGWFFTEDINSTLLLRQIVTSPEINTEHQVFKKTLDDKIKVKTYLTDRALTGAYKTNREKRWETHPNSVQFALRRECLSIERQLILQLCRFSGVPVEFTNQLITRGLLNRDFDFYRCPITGDELIYNEFKNNILNTQHGLSSFHVGHLNPLKAVNDQEVFGHTANNIGWISENGNRIQGSLTMAEVMTLLQRICHNHGWI